ncbi:MAG TPA: glycine cleavage system aminomethyltransferase GcvT [Terriglobales bacterium]
MPSDTQSPVAIRKTALNALHREMGAKMVDFSGWDMPVEYPKYGGLMKEHLAVRSGVGVFDVSHMGDIRLHGGQALDAVQHITMNDASKLEAGQCQYSAMLYPEGTFVDDVIVHRLGRSDYLLVINAGTREKDVSWVVDNTRQFDCAVEHLSDAYTQIAIQGPKSAATLQKLTDADLSKVRFYWFTHGSVCGLPGTLIARTGYTAEDGFEIYVSSDQATSVRVWNDVMKAGEEFGIVPCGLGARNTLRLEGALSLYGHEISERINVWEARLDRFLKMDKGDFVGREALAKAKSNGIKRTLVGVESIERGIPRDGYKVLDSTGKEVGYVTSGSYGPFLKKNIALAYVPSELSTLDNEVLVEIRNQPVKCKVVPIPFYKRPKRQS